MALKKWDTAVYGLLCLICLIFPLKLLKCETLVEFQTRVFRQVKRYPNGYLFTCLDTSRILFRGIRIQKTLSVLLTYAYMRYN